MEKRIRRQKRQVRKAIFLFLFCIPFSVNSALAAPAETASESRASLRAVPFSLSQATSQPAEAIPEKTTTDFLMTSSPFSAPDGDLEFRPVTEPEPGIQPNFPLPGTGDAEPALPEELISAVENPEGVTTLISETCKQQGETGEGVLSCNRLYSNGHRATVVTQRAAAGDEFKLQSVIKEYGRSDQLVSTKTIRQRIDYNYYEEDKGKERELLDIVHEAEGKPTVRELLIRQYHLDTGKMKRLTWARYEQVEDSKTATLIYHASLRYDSDGAPMRGVAEHWNAGKKIESYLNWNALAPNRPGLSRQSWHAWESWIQNISLQAYLP